MITIPRTIKKIANDVKDIVKENYPNVICIDDIHTSITDRWDKICNHENWHNDCDRYISDIISDIQYN